MSIYTKRGDDGTTGLLEGGRRAKDDVRIEAYGTVDELSSALGVAIAQCKEPWTTSLLREIQCDLFALGARLASPGKVPAGVPFGEDRLTTLETAIDEVDRQVPALRQFIRPGGDPAAATLHLARTICRRAERRVVTLHRDDPLDPFFLRYLNRLADLLFSLARYVNHKAGVGDEPVSGGACG
jgi:cob(I)alamin adenosyltransferase